MSENILTVKIPLGKTGLYALIDAKDYELVSKFKWRANKSNDCFYAVCQMEMGKINNKRTTCCMLLHRLILRPKQNEVIDHENHNPLNCTRGNMRVTTQQNNCRNRRPMKYALSRYKGVYWKKSHHKWCSCIYINYHRKHIGHFKTEQEAAIAYDIAAIKYFGKYAYINFPKDNYYMKEIA